MTVVFNVPGNPVGKQRARYAKRGNFVQTYTPEKTRTYETLIREHAQQAMGSSEALETPVTVYLYITHAVPSSYSKKRKEACLNRFERPKKPDLDNVAKAFMDAMNGIVYLDDVQVVSLHVTKLYGTESRVDVCIREELL